jgi:hypothetical protein
LYQLPIITSNDSINFQLSLPIFTIIWWAFYKFFHQLSGFTHYSSWYNRACTILWWWWLLNYCMIDENWCYEDDRSVRIDIRWLMMSVNYW